MTKVKTDNLNHESISPTKVEDRQDAVMNKGDFRIGLGQTTPKEEDQGMNVIIEEGQDMFLIIEVIMKTIWEVIRGMKEKIITKTEEEILGTKIMKIWIRHMIGKTEAITEGTIEALVIVSLGQVQEQVQIEIELDVSSAESTIIL